MAYKQIWGQNASGWARNWGSKHLLPGPTWGRGELCPSGPGPGWRDGAGLWKPSAALWFSSRRIRSASISKARAISWQWLSLIIPTQHRAMPPLDKIWEGDSPRKNQTITRITTGMEETKAGRKKPSLIIPFKSTLPQKSKALFSFPGTQHMFQPWEAVTGWIKLVVGSFPGKLLSWLLTV